MPKTLSRLLSQFHWKGRMVRGRHSQSRGEKARNIWKTSVLRSHLKSDLTTKRITVCTLLKVTVNCVVPSATHSGSGTAKIHTFTQWPQTSKGDVIILNAEKFSLTRKKWPFWSCPRHHSGSPPTYTHHLPSPSLPAAQRWPPGALRDLSGPCATQIR